MTANSPKQAAEARALLERERYGTLCTHAVDHPGYPFGSIVPYVVGDGARLFFLASTLAEHTRNFLADPRAALFVRDTSNPNSEPQVLARVTVLGDVEPAGSDEAESLFQALHPRSASYMKMADFSYYALVAKAMRYVGGFGRMSWVEDISGTPGVDS